MRLHYSYARKCTFRLYMNIWKIFTYFERRMKEVRYINFQINFLIFPDKLELEFIQLCFNNNVLHQRHVLEKLKILHSFIKFYVMPHLQQALKNKNPYSFVHSTKNKRQ